MRYNIYMKEKIPVGILGATGMVGQQYIRLLGSHPWFRVAYVAASPQSAGKKYAQALKSGWLVPGEVPADVADLTVQNVDDVQNSVGKCTFVFSAFEMPDKEAIKKAEDSYAAVGIPVFSNASAHRWTDQVPMLIAEVNPHHLDIIPEQQKARGWKKGFIVVKPNCSVQSYIPPIFALIQAGYEVDKLAITTLQSVSGAGYPGVPSLDVVDNVVPFISEEEEKSEREPLKILGDVIDGKFSDYKGLTISAHCNRVPVSDGHLACVSISFKGGKPSIEEIKKIWRSFSGEPQKLDLPFAPKQPIIYRDEPNRPQPKKDRDADKGMAVSVGRLREDNIFDYKFVALSHNTIRGAAGGGILNAELALKKGYLE